MRLKGVFQFNEIFNYFFSAYLLYLCIVLLISIVCTIVSGDLVYSVVNLNSVHYSQW